MPHHTSESLTPHEVLYSHVRAWNYCDMLIDRMAGFPFQNEIEALGDPLVHRCILTDPIFAASPEQAPLLVRLPRTQGALLEKFLTYALQEAADPEAQTRTVCAFLFSPLAQPRLGDLLTRMLDVPVQTVGNIYFRYFDPRVTHHLPRILRKSQLSNLFHGVQTWLYVNWTGQLNVIVPEPQDAVTRLALTAAQWRQMEYIEPFNIALCLLRQSGFQEQMLDSKIESRLFSVVHEAISAGLVMPEDQAAYAASAVKYGNDFTLHPCLPHAINAVTQHDVRFADALETYIGSTWDFI